MLPWTAGLIEHHTIPNRISAGVCFWTKPLLDQIRDLPGQTAPHVDIPVQLRETVDGGVIGPQRHDFVVSPVRNQFPDDGELTRRPRLAGIVGAQDRHEEPCLAAIDVTQMYIEVGLGQLADVLSPAIEEDRIPSLSKFDRDRLD